MHWTTSPNWRLRALRDALDGLQRPSFAAAAAAARGAARMAALRSAAQAALHTTRGVHLDSFGVVRVNTFPQTAQAFVVALRSTAKVSVGTHSIPQTIRVAYLAVLIRNVGISLPQHTHWRGSGCTFRRCGLSGFGFRLGFGFGFRFGFGSGFGCGFRFGSGFGSGSGFGRARSQWRRQNKTPSADMRSAR